MEQPGYCSSINMDGDVDLIIWCAIEDFLTNKQGGIRACLRDWDGYTYSTIQQVEYSENKWQNGASSWVEKTITFSDVSYTLATEHCLDVLIEVLVNSETLWFAYDTSAYPSRLLVRFGD